MNNDLISKSHFDKRVREAVGMTIAELTADFKDGVRTTLELLKTEPIVDAVQVVRCEDCRWYDKSTASGTYEPIAFKCKLHQRFTLGNMFCSDGEKDDA